MASLHLSMGIQAQQSLQRFNLGGDYKNTGAWLYLPKDYQVHDKDWPLLLFLHGAGERGDDTSLVLRHGPPRLIAEGRNFDFIVVSPQCPAERRWSPAMLEKLLDRVEKEYRVDKDRLWVTGLSMGGQGTWNLAMACPGRIAAIAPICGWADTTWAAAISHIPVWVFHGAKDPVVPLESSAAMVRTLERLGAPVKFTVYPEAGHDAWTETYADPALWDWITRQSRKQD